MEQFRGNRAEVTSGFSTAAGGGGQPDYWEA